MGLRRDQSGGVPRPWHDPVRSSHWLRAGGHHARWFLPDDGIHALLPHLCHTLRDDRHLDRSGIHLEVQALSLGALLGDWLLHRGVDLVALQQFANPQGQLKIVLQGFFAGNGLMNPVLYNAGLSINNTDCDSVTVEIRSTTSPFAIAQSVKGVLKTNGDVLFAPLCNCISRDYYVVVRTRNGIETWSKNPVHFNLSTLYRFDN